MRYLSTLLCLGVSLFLSPKAHAQYETRFLAGQAGISGFADNVGFAATFNTPLGITSDGAGNLYVADALNHRIRKIDIATSDVTTLAGNTAGYVDDIGTAALFNYPSGIAYDGIGNLYVADYYNSRIRKLVIATGEVTTIAGNGFGFNDGIGTAALFNGPTGIAYDAGNLFIADYGNHRIRKIEIATVRVSTVAGRGQIGNTNGVGTAASFNYPNSITADGMGNLFVADYRNHRIRKIIESTRRVSTLAGSDSGFSDGTGTLAQFSNPMGLAYDNAGNLLVADAFNHRIRQVNIATGEVTTAAGRLNGYQEGVGVNASFSGPSSITFISTGTFATTEYGHLVRFLDDLGTATSPTLAKTISLYPNPASSNVQVAWPKGALLLGLSINLMDVNGRVLRTYPTTKSNLDVKGLAPGLYCLQIGKYRSTLVIE